MRFGKDRLGDSSGLWSVLEQIQASALNFLISILLLNFAAKEEFGSYAILFSYLLLVVGVQTAIVSVPMTVELASNRFSGELDGYLKSLKRICWVVLATVSALMVLAVCTIRSSISPWAALAFFLALLGAALREFDRAALLIRKRLRLSFLVATVATFLIAVLLVSFGLLKGLDAALAFGITGGIWVLSSISVDRYLKQAVSPSRPKLMEFMGDVAGHARWALPGVLTIWVQNNLYLTIVGSILGVAQVADIAAGRLLIMPFVTVVTGMVRPLSAKWSRYASGDRGGAPSAETLGYGKLISVSAMGLFFTVLFVNAYFGEIVPDKFKDVLVVAAAWFVFAAVSGVRSLLTSVLHGFKAFRLLFLANGVSAVVSVGAVFFAARSGVLWTVPAALCAGEIVLFLMLYCRAKKMIREFAGGGGYEN